MMDARLAIGSGRTLVKDKRAIFGALFYRFLKDSILVPKLENLLLDLLVVGSFV
jgi:hypothetical protein